MGWSSGRFLLSVSSAVRLKSSTDLSGGMSQRTTSSCSHPIHRRRRLNKEEATNDDVDHVVHVDGFTTFCAAFQFASVSICIGCNQFLDCGRKPEIIVAGFLDDARPDFVLGMRTGRPEERCVVCATSVVESTTNHCTVIIDGGRRRRRRRGRRRRRKRKRRGEGKIV